MTQSERVSELFRRIRDLAYGGKDVILGYMRG